MQQAKFNAHETKESRPMIKRFRLWCIRVLLADEIETLWKLTCTAQDKYREHKAAHRRWKFKDPHTAAVVAELVHVYGSKMVAYKDAHDLLTKGEITRAKKD